MLFDPKWNEPKPVEKPDVYAVATLIAWLENQPSSKTYRFTNCDGECLLGQYMKANGIPWTRGSDKIHNYCKLINNTGWDGIALTFPQTFGAALQRARAFEKGQLICG